MTGVRSRNSRGSVALVALCFVAVMGIALASYLAVSNQAMKLSNRAYQVGLGEQLAEMGLEQALWSFNCNDWSDWTIDGNIATRTTTFPNTRYGNSGIVTTINLRVENYNAFTLPATWTANTWYHAGQYVLYPVDSNWYSCVASNNDASWNPGNWAIATQAVDSVNAGAYWNSGSYNLNDIVNRAGIWYRCILAHTNQGPPNSTFWSTAPLRSPFWSAGSYDVNNIVYDHGAWYRCTQSPTSAQPPANSSYWASATPAVWSGTKSYVVDDYCRVDGTVYRCTTASTGVSPPDASSWTVVNLYWNPTTTYQPNDYVSYGSVWYRCLNTSSGERPSNSPHWATNAPVIYAQGVISPPDGVSGLIQTQLRAVVGPASLFPNAAAATNILVMSSNGTVDSYDTSMGLTPAAPNLGSSAVVAGGNINGTGVTINSGRINGYVAAAPSAVPPYPARFSYGGNVIVTDAPAPTIPSPKIDPNRVSRSPSIPQFDILTPNTGSAAPLPNTANATSNLGSPTDTTWQTFTYAANLNFNDNRVYNINGPVRIVIGNNGNYFQNLSSGAAVININPGGKLEIYLGGDLALYGQGINNLTKLPRNLVIYSTTNSSAPDINATNDFYGVLYMPNGKFTVAANKKIFGALSTRNLSLSSGTTLHYDTTLRYATFPGVDSPYLLTEWRELTDPAERITF